MTKDVLDQTLFETVINYNRLKSLMTLANDMVRKGDIPLAKQYLSIAQYSLEQTYITLEKLQLEVEHSRSITKAPRIRKHHDTSNRE